MFKVVWRSREFCKKTDTMTTSNEWINEIIYIFFFQTKFQFNCTAALALFKSIQRNAIAQTTEGKEKTILTWGCYLSNSMLLLEGRAFWYRRSAKHWIVMKEMSRSGREKIKRTTYAIKTFYNCFKMSESFKMALYTDRWYMAKECL